MIAAVTQGGCLLINDLKDLYLDLTGDEAEELPRATRQYIAEKLESTQAALLASVISSMLDELENNPAAIDDITKAESEDWWADEAWDAYYDVEEEQAGKTIRQALNLKGF